MLTHHFLVSNKHSKHQLKQASLIEVFALRSALQEVRERRMREYFQQNALSKEAAVNGAGTLQSVPEHDLQVILHAV